MGKFTYDVYTSGMKEYILEFDSVEDAENAYDIAEIWRDDYRGIYEPWLGDQELFIVCRNDTLHRFIDCLEATLGVENGGLK